jgi:hypothetical protein
MAGREELAFVLLMKITGIAGAGANWDAPESQKSRGRTYESRFYNKGWFFVRFFLFLGEIESEAFLHQTCKK